MTYIAFGISKNFYSYIERLDEILDIQYFCDNDEKKWFQYSFGDERMCISPSMICELDNPMVIIFAEKESSKRAIEAQCDAMGVPHKRVEDIIDSTAFPIVDVSWPQKIQRKRIHKFIELLVHGTTECNFRCDYCYVWKKEDFHNGVVASEHSPEEIRKALSKDRLGGICHINMCALGETLLAQNIENIVYELADEGHYVSIITNGTITPKIKKITSFPKQIQERIFFKLSYHFLELNRVGLSEVFWNNAKMIKQSSCSFSIEITPSDLIIDSIDKIKDEFNDYMNGAMPHITFTRDATKEGLDLYSDLSLGDYKKVWGQFDSELFNLKSKLYKEKIDDNCYAGNWSYRINLVNGNIQSCYQQKVEETIFDDVSKNLPIRTVGRGCALNYCFNNHAFISWGDVPSIKCQNYLSMRDRIDNCGDNWVREPYKAIMRQKLYDNNFEYIDRWPDYDKLFSRDREPAFVLFNSPDYGNLGDQAIAYAEREYFEKKYPKKDFIEVSCNQYIRENLMIKNAILDDDIILITGGGYIGSVWTWLEDLTLNIIKTFPNNKIIVMPQTIYFHSNTFGNSEKNLFVKTVNSHTDIHIFVRDTKSLKQLEEAGVNPNKYSKSVDMAMTLDLSKYRNTLREDKAMICFRSDVESNGVDREAVISELKNRFGNRIEEFSTVVDTDINLTNRDKVLDGLWKKLSKASLVVTDRLHAAIFSALLNIPCVAFDNSTGKVSDLINNFKKDKPIELCLDITSFAECIDMVLEKETDFIQNNIKDCFETMDSYFEGSTIK